MQERRNTNNNSNYAQIQYNHTIQPINKQIVQNLPNVVRPCCREAAALRGARHVRQFKTSSSL